MRRLLHRILYWLCTPLRREGHRWRVLRHGPHGVTQRCPVCTQAYPATLPQCPWCAHLWETRRVLLGGVVGWVVLVGISGCTPDLVSLTEALNARNISSCVMLDGAYMGLSAHVVTATGQATLEECQQWR